MLLHTATNAAWSQASEIAIDASAIPPDACSYKRNCGTSLGSEAAQISVGRLLPHWHHWAKLMHLSGCTHNNRCFERQHEKLWRVDEEATKIQGNLLRYFFEPFHQFSYLTYLLRIKHY